MSARAVQREKENDEEQGASTSDAPAAPAPREPLTELADNSQIVPSKRHTRMMLQSQVKAVQQLPFTHNHFPKNINIHRPRVFLKVEPYKNPRQNEITAEYLPEADTNCAFCYEKVSPLGDTELITCHGTFTGLKNANSEDKVERPCKTRFHVKCISDYNASSFLFLYAARTECQNKLLCPLHCCSLCNNDHYKQVAYHGKMTECVICLRGFHTEWCIPAGSKPVEATVEYEGRDIHVNMIVCPTHIENTSLSSKQKHLVDCDECMSKDSLIKCRTCIRVFHTGCQDVKTVDGVPIAKDQCEKCLAGDVIRLDVPVMVGWQFTQFFPAITRDWSYYPDKSEHGRPGHCVVEWITGKKRKEFSVTNVNKLAPIVQQYIKSEKRPDQQRLLEQATEDYDIFSRLPTLYKKVDKTIATSRYAPGTGKKFKRCVETLLCACKGDNRCIDDTCHFVRDHHECPPFCEADGRKCNNRNVTKKLVNPKIELRKAGRKGFGVFAKEALKKGEFLAEYAGEIINKAEKDERRRIAAESLDFQANHYIMELSMGLSVDACRMGNIARYVNHSCEPNAYATVTSIYVSGDGARDDELVYEPRLRLTTIKDIAADQEITFNYAMGESNDVDGVPKCYCGSAKCVGIMSNERKDKRKGESESETDSETESESDDDDQPGPSNRKKKTTTTKKVVKKEEAQKANRKRKNGGQDTASSDAEPTQQPKRPTQPARRSAPAPVVAASPLNVAPGSTLTAYGRRLAESRARAFRLSTPRNTFTANSTFEVSRDARSARRGAPVAPTTPAAPSAPATPTTPATSNPERRSARGHVPKTKFQIEE